MKNFVLVLSLLSLILLSGCFDYDEALVLNKDGSGSLQMKCSVSKVYLDQMQQMYAQMAKAMPDLDIPDDPRDMIFNRNKIDEALKAEDSGVELVKYEMSETDDMQTWDMKFSFTDLNRLDALDKALSPDEPGMEYQEEDLETDEEPLLTKQDDGTWLFLRSFKDKMEAEAFGGEDGEYYQDEYGEYEDQENGDEKYSYDDEEYNEGSVLGGISAEMEEGLNQFVEGFGLNAEEMGDHKLRFSITFPGKIIESNATSVDGNTAIWEYSLNQIENSMPDQKAVIDFD